MGMCVCGGGVGGEQFGWRTSKQKIALECGNCQNDFCFPFLDFGVQATGSCPSGGGALWAMELLLGMVIASGESRNKIKLCLLMEF